MIKTYPSYVETQSRWLGRLPDHWQLTRLDRTCAARTSNVDKHTVVGQPAVRLCNYTDVYKNDTITDAMEFMTATATAEQIERFKLRIGDTIITKDSETADDIGIPAFVDYEATDLVCGYHLAIIRPSPALVPKFLYWVMDSRPTKEQWATLASGVTRVGIRSSDLSKAEYPLPPLPEQKRIADYLDRETTQIDTLIEAQQQLVAMLGERRIAAIAHATSHGADVEFRRVIASLRQGWSPNCENWPADGTSEWGVLKVGCANAGRFDPMENKRLPDDETPRPEFALRRGEIVMSRSNTKERVGAAAVVDGHYPRLLLSDLTYSISLTSDADPEFVAYALSSPALRAQIGAASKGMSHSMQKISQRDIRELRLRLPSLNEQRQTTALLNEQTARIDALIAETEQFIELSRERRTALITAAVTGQIDVRDEAA